MKRRTWFLLVLASLFNATKPQIFRGIWNFFNEIQNQRHQEPPNTEDVDDEYDFIVVGAGTAGCVVANRLTENPEWKVLLIEAGGRENFLMDIPILANYLQFSESNWRYLTQPSEAFCLGMENKRCHFPRGKVMGGTSVLNYMLYNRGNHEDFDRWARLGNTGWSYDEVLPYFKKIEDFEIPELYNETYHGKGGYLSVSYAPYRTKIASSLIDAGAELGWKYVDYNAREQIGISYAQVTLKDGVRHSSSKAYLHPIRNRENLFVKKETRVTRVLIDPTTKQAYGVEYVSKDEDIVRTVRARKEVILSAGAIGSPHLLLLSGVGPKRDLQKLGMHVIQDLKVGYNHMDHIACGGISFVVNDTISLKTEMMFRQEYLSAYLNDHNGPLSVPGGLEAVSFHNTEYPNDTNAHPDIELLYMGGSIASDPMLHKNFVIRSGLYKDAFEDLVGMDSFTIFPILLRPKSRGRIKLLDGDYKTRPLIYPKYFSHPKDMEVMIRGIQLVMEIAGQPAMQKIGTQLYGKPIPNCKKFEFGSDKYWECVTRYVTLTIHHHSGTCKMGPATDMHAVVDPRLRVHGIKGLRVIDASIMPEITAAHTNAPTYMIAEKGSDLIKEDHRNNLDG